MTQYHKNFVKIKNDNPKFHIKICNICHQTTSGIYNDRFLLKDTTVLNMLTKNIISPCSY